MSALRSSAADYLELRRALGYKLERDERFLKQFIDYLESRGEPTLTGELALAWATLPAGTGPGWWSSRLGAVRGFASYLQTIDPTIEVPPRVAAFGPRRSTPFLYSDADVAAVLRAAEGLMFPLGVATYQTLIALLAVTGMRVGEAIAADRDDFDIATGVLVVRHAKFGKSRALPLHASTVAALADYLDQRDRLHRRPRAPSLFISTAGTRLIYQNVHKTFFRLVRHAGLRPRSATCRPRIHDLRHSFAVRTMLDWYEAGVDVQAQLPLLSTYLGHVHPSDTYWYLSAAPELLAFAGERLERHLGGAA
jgi:integrase/recombinase XerD